MKLYRTLDALQKATAPDKRGCVATIGGYDGLHLGHQHILDELKRRAAAGSAATLVFSFEPTPKEYFGGERAPARLTRFRERFVLLAQLGIDRFFCPRFGEAMRRMSARAFIDELLVDGVRPACLVVGDDFRFARGREGDVAMLQAAGARHGFDVVQVESVAVDGVRVSSSAVRDALAAGDLGLARRLLGREYSMMGRVVPGRNLGRALGFPTANVNLARRVSPLQGIYAVRVAGLGPQLRDGVASVGTRPTVGSTEPVLEVHLFDFDEDIYGRMITVQFAAKLRDEEKFPSVAQMVKQMYRDCDHAREVLAA